MFLRWFISPTVRQACAMRSHVHRLLSAQRDLLPSQAVGKMTGALAAVQDAVRSGAKDEALKKELERLEQAANQWLKPYPHALWRENVEAILVVVTVVMAFRIFFVGQSFKIPTGSMQPTLFGVTSRNMINDPGFKKPTGWERVKEWFAGVSYVHFVAPTDGTVEGITRPWPPAVLSIYQRIKFAGEWHMIWFPPDYGEMPLEYRAGLEPGRLYHKGQDVVNLQVQAGDHLFVDRLSYNFRKPRRGEIVVFATAGIPEEQREKFRIPGDQFYIKRLVGLGGETLALAQDYEVTGAPQFGSGGVPVGHLLVNGQPLSASIPHFENLYSFPGVPRGTKTIQYQENQYYGHALIRELEPGREFQVATNHLFVMGDNTMNSLDSRFWGDFPATSCIGKSFFVYWPVTKRFGWGNQ
jgi:signal peptidase I